MSMPTAMPRALPAAYAESMRAAMHVRNGRTYERELRDSINLSPNASRTKAAR